MEAGIEKIKKKSYVTMIENEKKNKKSSSENVNNTVELSTIYVRRKKNKCTCDLCFSQDMYLKRENIFHKYNKNKIFKYTKLNNTPYYNTKSYLINKISFLNLKKIYSMPIISNSDKRYNKKFSANWNRFYSNYSCRYKTDFIVNIMLGTQYRNSNCKSHLNPCWNIFRCQLNSKEETCCCSCNSDAMFEVMKSLYDCYKKKNCDNCNCILCGHLPREERRLGELRKSELGIARADRKEKKKAKKVIKTSMSAPLAGQEIPPEKLKKMKAEGLLTPLKGKTPEQKEKILKGLAMNGIPLPTGKTASDKRIIDKVRNDLGLPPEPKTSADKKKYEKALASGFITPLEGKSAPEKERVLRGQAALGLPLSEGRTPSEKNLIAKIKSETPPTAVKLPSAKLRKAKAEGLLTPLEGKTPEQKEKILRGLAKNGIPLPTGKTASENKLIDKVRKDVGLPPEPKTSAEKENYDKALAAGLITPLQGKPAPEKERILRGQAALGLPLPEGRTPSEKSLIAKIKTEAPTTAFKLPSARLRKAKAEGLLTPLEGKAPEQKERILKGLALNGIPLPSGKTSSEKKLIDKVRKDIGLPPEPKTSADKKKYDKALVAGLITPLEGKSAPEKERILRGQAALGLPLPEARTPSEKNLIEKVKAAAPLTAFKIPSTKLRKAKAEGLLTPLDGKTPQQKQKILRGLAMNGIPLPKGKTVSEKQLIDKVRKDVGLPPEPKTSAEKRNYDTALASGFITPLEGKSAPEKERILRGQAALGLPLPEGRTPSEKNLIAKVQATEPPPTAFKIPSAKLRKAKAEGLLTPLEGKTPKQKEKILKGLAINGIPLPRGKTASEKQLIDKVRKDIGLPPEPRTSAEKRNYDKALASGFITPLEGKSAPEKERILRGQAALGLPLPEGRTPSEKNLIAKVQATEPPPTAFKIPSAKLRKAKAEGLLTPLEGKTPQQKEKILKGLAINGIPLPRGKTASEKQLIDKVRKDIGLPPEPRTSAEKRNYDKALASGFITPLEGKSAPEKERILRGQAALGLPLPEGRTASEKNLIAKVQATQPPPTAFKIPSAKLRKAKAQGLLTPLEGKTPQQKEKILKGLAMNGIPLPKGKTPSEKQLIDKVRKDVGLPPEPKTSAEKINYDKALASGFITPLEGKSAPEKERILRGQAAVGLPLPEGRTASEKNLIAKVQATEPPPTAFKIPSAKLRKAKAEGLLTPLEGKTPQQKEKILKGLAINGIPLPKGKTPSEKQLIDKVRKDVGLPPEPKTSAEKINYDKALASGFITPLEGKSAPEKERILRGQAAVGLPLPEGRTPSEKNLIVKVQATEPPPTAFKIPSAKLRKAKAEGLLTPLEGKTPQQKEKILKGLAINGIPLPRGKTASEKQLIDKVRKDIGLPPEPRTSAEKRNYNKALASGFITPLEGKSTPEKERILRGQAALGLPLPEGRTASEKNLIAKVQATEPPPTAFKIPSVKLRKAKAKGLLTPLEGKTPQQKEKILKGLAMNGIPLPKGKTPSEKQLIDKVRKDVGLPPEPKTSAEKRNYDKALASGFITPLEGKPAPEKERILRGQAALGLPLPEGRTPSERNLIATVQAIEPPPTAFKIPSAKLRKAKAEGLLTPLEGKTAEQKQNILKGLAMNGIPLPKGKTASEKQLIDKVRKDVGLPPEPKTSAEKKNYDKAFASGLVTPLEGKSAPEKERILKGQAALGLPLPEGRTPSEKNLIAKVKATAPPPSAFKIPSAKLRKAQAEGLLTPLEGKTPQQKEKILKGLAMNGIPLPEGKTASEKKLIDKVRKNVGLPPAPKTSADKDIYEKAMASGLVTPLEGKSKPEKEKILKGQADLGLPLPEGRTRSEKAIIKNIKSEKKKLTKLDTKTMKNLKEGKGPSDECICGILTAESKKVTKELKTPTEKLAAAKAAGLLTPLEGKMPAQKEKIMRGLAKQGLPLPEAKTTSEKKLLEKVRADLGLPPEPTSPSLKEKYAKAQELGIMTPLEGKTPSQKEKILTKQAELGLPLPEGRTPSEKDLINKIRATIKPSARALDKLRKAKEAGLLTPLEGKTPAQKEKIMRGLAKQGLPLPEAKTTSEKKLLEKVRADLGLPPEPTSPSLKEKYAKAQELGIMTPLEGKTPSQKEKILTKQAELGLPLPEGRTPSEKDLINNIRATIKPSTRVLDKLRKAKEAGLLTPLEGKTPAQKEKIIRGLAKQGIPLPEPKTTSEKKLLEKVRADLGLPPEPTSPSLKEKYAKAQELGIMTPLEGKTPSQKEKILTKQAELGLPLPEGRTRSEKDLINKIRATIKPSARALDRLRKAKETGILTPLEGKTTAQKEKIMRGLAKQGIPLPEPKTTSEKKLLEKVRADLGLPPEPTSPSLKEKYAKAQELGVMTPLEGKTPSKKEKILTKQAELGLPLPEGRTPSEKNLINKIRATIKPSARALDRLRKAKEAGILTPLEGKTPAQKEKIMRGLAKQGIPLPEPKTTSEKKLLEKVRADLGLPPEPISPTLKEKYAKAQELGIMTPLEGKTPSQKEKILTKQAELGLPLPEGRTPSEKDLINKIRATIKPSARALDKLRKAKEAGLLTPLEGKTPEEKKRILRNIIKAGLPVPEGKTPSEKILIKKVRDDMGLPSKGIPSETLRKAKAAGLITPLEGKTHAQKEKILRDRVAAGLPLPEGVTASDKEMIKRIKSSVGYVSPKFGPPEKKSPSAKLRQAKAAGLLTPLEGKSPDQKEKILKGLAKAGIPLPEGKTKSEKKIIDKVRQELGLPPEPKNASIKEKMKQAQLAGIITPLEGKTPAEKEKILTKMHDAGLPLPKGRTASEKALIKKVKAGRVAEPYKVSSEKFRKAKAAGLLTPIEGKTPAQKEKILRGLHRTGIPLPEGKTISEKALIKKIQAEKVLSPEKISKIDKKTAKVMKEGKGPSDECICDLLSPISITPSVKAYQVASEKLRKSKAAGLLTPLSGKAPEQKEKILKKLAMQGIPFPDPKTPSETKLFNKVRADLGLPPEPKTSAEKEKYNNAIATGIIVPLEGKSPAEKEKILRKQAQMGLPLPVGRTPSEKALIDNIRATTKYPSKVYVPSKKVPGVMTPLEGKTPEQKEKILKKMAVQGIPFPDPRTSSEAKLFDKVRAGLGLPPEPKIPAEKEKYNNAIATGIIVPLEGKSLADKEKILRKQAQMGLPLPVGRTPSEKALIDNIKATTKPLSKVYIPSKKFSGLITPLEGKTPAQKEKILKKMAMQGIPFPDPKTPSETKLFDKVRDDVGLPPEPKTLAEKEKYKDAFATGIIVPLEGKTPKEKERILRGQAQMGLPLPKGRTPSEQALINNVKATTKPLSKVYIPSRKAGLITPLEGKPPEQKEKILKKMAVQGVPFPDPRTPSEAKLFDKVRADLGLPPEPKIPAEIEKYKDAIAAGIIVPLEGKSPVEKEKILRKQAQMGLPLPEGRTSSEKALIDNIKATTKPLSKVYIPSRKTGLITPLEGKTSEQKEKILKKMAMQGIPFPDPKTPSETKLFDKIRADIGLPPEPKTLTEKAKYKDAAAAGVIVPLEGKSPAEKEKILRKQAQMGLPLPVGRTPSEKALIDNIKATTKALSKIHVPSMKAGLITPLEGKPPEQKKKILKKMAMQGIPFPEPKNTAEKKIFDKVRADVGLPPEPKTQEDKQKYKDAVAAGIIAPLEGKSPTEKEKILRGQAEMGLPLPKGRTRSEKALIKKIKATTLPPEKLSKLDKKSAKVIKEGKGPSDECICPMLAHKESIKPVLREPSKRFVGTPSEKLRRAKEAGLLTPLKGKSPEQKEKILKGLAMQGIPLPEGQTPSEKKLIDKVRADIGLPPEPKSETEKRAYNKALAAGLIAPLEGKSKPEKAKILRKVVQLGLPLPEGRTSSEKSLIAKIKQTAPTPIEADLLTTIEGKPPEKREKILKSLAEAGLPLPEGRTPSEKSLITKVKAEYGIPPKGRTPSEKKIIDKAKAEGLFTPLKGKTPAQKEKILKSLAEAGLPLPEGKTTSEKSLVTKVKAEYGILPKPRSSSEKKIIDTAKAEGLFTPLKGKTPAQKEKILKSLAKSGLPMPDGTTPSEKELVRKVKASVGILPERIKTKSKKVGVAGVSKSKGGIIEKFEDIVKTTTCDRGCGCDKKKIRFKHSYVKIRVTSPDISSLCPCPDECVPGVKGGVFTDNDGIKVTVGRVTGIPSFSSRKSDDKNGDDIHKTHSDITYSKIQMINFVSSRSNKNSVKYDIVEIYKQKYESNRYDIKSDDKNSLQQDCSVYSSIHMSKSDFISNDEINKLDNHYKSEISESYKGNCIKSVSIFLSDYYVSDISSNTSFESIYLINRDSSLSLLTVPSSISVMSLSTKNSLSSLSFNKQQHFIDSNMMPYKEFESIENITYDMMTSEIIRHNDFECFSDSDIQAKLNNSIKHNYIVFKINDSKPCYVMDVNSFHNEESESKKLSNACDLKKLLCKILSSRHLHKTSSLIIVMSTTSVSSSYSVGSRSSTIGIDLFEKRCNWNYAANSLRHLNQSQGGFKYTTGAKKIKRREASTSIIDSIKHKNIQPQKADTAATNCIMVANKELKPQKNECRIISTDTTQDRPCCCESRKEEILIPNNVNERKLENIVTEIVTPIIIKEATAQGLSQETYINSPQNNLISQSAYTPCYSNICMSTPVRICKIPPCSGHSGCHYHSKPMRELEQKVSNEIVPDHVKACDCSLEKLIDLYEKRTKQMLSKACGVSKEAIFKKHVQSNLKPTILVPSESTNASCTTCGSAKYPEKNFKHLCPCEQHQNFTRENDYQNQSQNYKDDNYRNRCQCKEQKNSKNNITCECPAEPELEPEIDFGEWIDEKQIKKLKSDLTQTVSGFKINIPRKRSNFDLEMSFEDALRYYAKNLEDEENNINNNACACKNTKSTKSKNINCECPYEPPTSIFEYQTPLDEEEEPFRGIKFHISGKGSGSKGLNGILCFELLKGTTI